MGTDGVKNKSRGGLDLSLRQWILASLAGVPASGKVIALVPVDSSTSGFRTALHDLGMSYNDMYTDINVAYYRMSDYANDTLLVFPGGHSLGSSAVTWAKNYTNIVGVCTPVPFGGRARLTTGSIDASVAFTVSARSFLMKNIHMQFGGGNSSARTLLKMTYSGDSNNCLLNCDLNGPINATEAAAAYRILELGAGTQSIFVKGGKIGAWTVAAGEADGYELYCTSNNGLVQFEDVLFQAYSTEAGHCFVYNAADPGGEAALLKFTRCDFFQGDRDVTLTKVLDSHPTQGCSWFIDCHAYNVTDWAESASATVKVSTPATNEAGGIGTAVS